MTQAQKLFQPASAGRRLLRKGTELLLARSRLGSALGSLPFFRRYYTTLVMARRDHTGLHSGIYASYAEAFADIPASRLSGWDLDETAKLWVGQIDPVRLSTYPVFFWLSRIFQPGMQLVDAGGSIGLTYYGYRRHAGIPDSASWTVVEMPRICAQGEAIAQREKAAGLQFLSALEQAPACDIFLAAGALQYIPESIPGLLEKLASKPRYVLLNKLPITDQGNCWTLQNYGPGVTPMQLFNEESFLAYFRSHGYALRDRWVCEDLDCLIPFHPQRFIRTFSGFLFELGQ